MTEISLKAFRKCLGPDVLPVCLFMYSEEETEYRDLWHNNLGRLKFTYQRETNYVDTNMYMLDKIHVLSYDILATIKTNTVVLDGDEELIVHFILQG